MNLNVLRDLILLPLFVLFIIFFFYKFTKRNFKELRLGAVFFLFAFSLLAYFYLTQIVSLFSLPDTILRGYPVIQKIFILLIIVSGAIISLKIFDEITFNKYLYKKADIHVPTLFRDIIVFSLLAIIIIITLRIEFGIKLTGILTSSAIISVIIGLALQDTLSNIISGIVIHIEKPFKIGDWIKAGAQEGEVAEISWRATRFKTIEGNYIIIPNTTISKEIILNYSEPDKSHAITFIVGVEYSASPNKVKESILKAIDDSDSVLKNPGPAVNIINFSDYSIQYEIKIWINNHYLYRQIQDDVMTKILYNFRRNSVQIPFPIQNIYLNKVEQPAAANQSDDLDVRLNFIKRVEIFKDVPEKDMKHLAEICKIKYFTKGERIISQGERGYSLYVITEGNVSVLGYDAKGSLIPVQGLKEGDYFGEMSLLTGEKRSATIVAQSEVGLLEIAPSDILPIITNHPNLLAGLSSKLAERKLNTKDILDQALANEKKLEKDALSKNIFSRIKDFFSVK